MPWKWMFESDVFGVKIPETGSIYFISIMGSGEEFLAVSAYRGVRALEQFWQFQEGDYDPEPETFLTIPQIMLSFTDQPRAACKHKILRDHFPGQRALDKANVRLLLVRTMEAMDEAVLSLIEHLGPAGN